MNTAAGHALVATFFALACFILLNGWVTEDAFITFRVVDNVVNGYGLRWNTSERVQVYTHPLWLLLHLPFYAVWRNIFLISIFLGASCTLGAIALVLHTFRKPPQTAMVTFLLPLALSHSFIEFSTSGLENSLSYLLFAWFGYCVLRLRTHRYFWFYCALSVALAGLNRLDTLLLILPACLYLLSANRYEIRRWQIALGLMPLLGWLAFSLFYYGFLFPNTKYAKLNTGIDAGAYIVQGLHYVVEFFISDSFSFMLLCASWITAIEYAKDARKKHPDAALLLAINLGVIAYMAYIIFIGGDFMSGRFWSLPFFTGMWLIYAAIPPLKRSRLIIITLFFCALAWLSAGMRTDALEECRQNDILSHQKTPGIAQAPTCIRTGIADEKEFYSPYNLWFDGQHFSADRWRTHPFILEKEAQLRAHDPVIVSYNAGLLGYIAGPLQFLLDPFALTDPLLSRLPVRDARDWRIGHFARPLPGGYKDALATGDTSHMQPDLAHYYEKLHLITAGDLLNWQRLKTIFLFNLGYYDHWKQRYIDQQK